MRVLVSLSLSSSLMLASACGGSTTSSVVGPTGTAGRCQITLNAPRVPFAGAQLTAQVLATRDCDWSATSEVPWLVIEPSTGTGRGDGTVALAVEANPTGRVRNASIAINGQHFTVVQDPQPCRFDVTPHEVGVPSFGGRLSIQVTTLDGCAWTSVSSQPWVRVIAGSGGDSSRAIEVGVESNPGDDRSAQLTVAGNVVDVRQGRASTEATKCDYSMDPGAGPIFSAAGGIGQAAVHVHPLCYWFARSNQPWVVILSNTNGNGRSDIQYRVDANPSRSQRSAQITAGTVRHVITQRGAS